LGCEYPLFKLGGGNIDPPSNFRKKLQWGWNFLKSCKKKIDGQISIKNWCDVFMTSFCHKNRQNQFPSRCFKWAEILTQVLKSVKKRKKSTQKSLWRHCDVILANFCITNEKIRFFHFYGGLSEKNTKNYVTRRKHFDFWTTNIFYNFWLSFSPIWPFFGNLCHFSFFTCFVLEVPENRWFLQIIFWKRHKIWKLFACNCVKFLKKFRTSVFLTIDTMYILYIHMYFVVFTYYYICIFS